MARGVNKAILVGNLGRDPEVRYSPSGAAVANVSIATTDTWKDKNTGEQQERTEWHRVVFFGRLAEIAGEYLKKGYHSSVDGRPQSRTRQDKDGNDRFTTEIVANDMQMLGGRSGAGAAPGAYAEDYNQDAAYSGRGGESSSAGPKEDFDDDIPF